MNAFNLCWFVWRWYILLEFVCRLYWKTSELQWLTARLLPRVSVSVRCFLHHTVMVTVTPTGRKTFVSKRHYLNSCLVYSEEFDLWWIHRCFLPLVDMDWWHFWFTSKSLQVLHQQDWYSAQIGWLRFTTTTTPSSAKIHGRLQRINRYLLRKYSQKNKEMKRKLTHAKKILKISTVVLEICS